MDQPPLDALMLEVRSAVLAGDHVAVGRLAEEYAQALSHFWEPLSDVERANSTVPEQALQLLAWTREMAIIQRALTADHMAIVEKASRYLRA